MPSFDAAPGGVDVEITEHCSPSTAANDPSYRFVVPSRVVVNGQEIAVPKDTPVVISEIRPDVPVTVTVTMLVRRLTIGIVDPAAESEAVSG